MARSHDAVWTLPLVLVALLPLSIPEASRGVAISLVTPYVNEADMATINEAFSMDSCAPWGFEHRGIDFFPTGSLELFQAACGGTVQHVGKLFNEGNGFWQVNLSIACDATYGVGYAFEPISALESDGDLQLSLITVTQGQTVSQGDLLGSLLMVGLGAHVHFDFYVDGEPSCPAEELTPTARSSVLDVLHAAWPYARLCYGLPRTLPEATITVDGSVRDWSGLGAEAVDWQNDDSVMPAFDGDDLQALYMARDDDNLYLRLDLWEAANPDFQNGPTPGEAGRYSFSIPSDGPYPSLYLSVVYDGLISQWSLGANGSNGAGTPPTLVGPAYVGVSGAVIEVAVPFSIIGIPVAFGEIHAEATDCCHSPVITTLDETHCVSGLFLPLFEDGFESGDTARWSKVSG